MADERLAELSDYILENFGDFMANRTVITSPNPKIKHILKIQKNIMFITKNQFLLARDERYFNNFITYKYRGAENPEQLFQDRDFKLRRYKRRNENQVCKVSFLLSISVFFLSVMYTCSFFSTN